MMIADIICHVTALESRVAIEQLGSWVCAVRCIALSHLISACNQIWYTNSK